MSLLELQQKFKGKYKLTSQRKIIFRTLGDHPGRHLSAEEIFEIVRQQCPEIGLATIYRTLELLSTLGVVQKLDFGDGRHRYELSVRPSPQHQHMICIFCGKVLEATGCFPEKFEPNMNAFSIVDYRVYIYGYCNECQSKHQ